MKRTKSSCSTKMKVYKEELQWDIEGFSLTYPNIFLQQDLSPVERFKLLPKTPARPAGLLGTRGTFEANIGELICSLSAKLHNYDYIGLGGLVHFLIAPEWRSETILEKSIRFKVRLVDGEGKTFYDTDAELSRGYRWAYHLPSLEEIWSNKKLYFPNDVLRIRIDITFLSETQAQDECDCLPRRLARLSEDMLNLLNSGGDADIKIVCGNLTLPAHRSILSARSPVFCRMFATEMKEKSSNVVTIDDMEPSVLQIMIEYIYASKVDVELIDFEKLLKLLTASDKYDLLELKKLCFDQLLLRMDDNTCGHLAVAAYLHGASKGIRDNIFEFFRKKWQKLMKETDFAKLVDEFPKAFLEPVGL